MTGYELLLLWFAWVLAGGSPGPATLGIAGTSMNAGRKLGLVFSLGILAGSAFWGIAAALGMSAIMLANGWMFEIIRYLGAAYLLYLAFKSARSALSAKAPLLQKGQSGSVAKVFSKGALIHLTKPKAILSWGAVFLFLYLGSILVFIGYAFLFSTHRIVGAYARARRWFEGIFAALFGVAALKIMTAKLT